jgi:hypothetical protein
MYIVSILSEGWGNKLFMLFNLASIWIKLKKVGFDKVYILNKPSKHDLGDPSENIESIFPNLYKSGIFQEITWKDYDKLKGVPKFKNTPQSDISESFEIVSDYNFRNIDIDSIKPLFKTLFKTSYKSRKYNFKNGIFVHIRYGDKLKINSKLNSFVHYELLYPKYYIDMITSFSDWESSPIYIFTDSPEIVRRCFPMDRVEIVDEPWWNVFGIFTKARRVVFGESTLTIGAAILNKDYEGRFYSNTKKIYDKYVQDNCKIIKDKKYLIGVGKETVEFIRKCS